MVTGALLNIQTLLWVTLHQPLFAVLLGSAAWIAVFRYQAKAPKSERPVINGKAHPTVKPLALMRWLAVLFTPPGGTVLDPFTGSGTTGEAAQLDGFEAILIDDDPASIAWTQQRLLKAAS